MEEMQEMSIIQHLEELRYRLFIIIGIVLVLSLLAFFFADSLRKLILYPAGDIFLVYLTPPEALLASIRLAITAGALVAVPVLIYQILAFILPAFYKEEKKIIIPMFLAIGFLFYGGLAFAYFIVFPIALGFFMGFATEGLRPMFTFNSYLAFFTRFHLSFALVFQVPLLFAFLGHLGIIHSKQLRRGKKYAVLVIVILSALITPPDFISQLLMIGPLYLLFELGILLVRLTERRRRKRRESEENED